MPFIEFGHHVARLKLSSAGVMLLADGESVNVAQTAEVRYEPGKRYHLLAELKGDEFVVQFADGPTLYAKHPSFAKPTESGGNGLGVAGPQGGVVEIDDVAIWSVKTEFQPGWEAARAKLPTFTPVEVVTKKRTPQSK